MRIFKVEKPNAAKLCSYLLLLCENDQPLKNIFFYNFLSSRTALLVR